MRQSNTCSAIALRAGILVLSTIGMRANAYMDHYTYDPDFDGGVVLDDRFATGADTPHFAEKMLVLPSGEIVVAGLVPTAAQTGNIVGGNIGLVHYTAGGGREGWANPTASYASYYNIYITYPNDASATFAHVVDMKVVGDYIYILADYQFSSLDKDVYILVFGTDGSFVGQYGAFTTGLYEYGAGLVPYSYTIVLGGGLVKTFSSIIAVASYDSGDVVLSNGTSVPHWVVTMKRFTIGSGGTLAVDTTFGHIGNGAIDQPLPVDFCGSQADNPCSGGAAHVAAVRTDTSSPTLYVLGNATTYGNQSNDAFVMAVDGFSGDLLTSFGSGGIYDQSIPGSTDLYGFSNDRGSAVGIFATNTGADPSGDVVYAITKSRTFDGGCDYMGAAVDKLRANSGPPFYATLPDFAWGVGGTATIAHCATSADSATYHFFPQSAITDGDRIAVSGQASNGEPIIGGVRLSDGKPASFGILPWLRSDGSRWDGTQYSSTLDGGFSDISSTGNGKFAVTGTMCDATATVACALFGTMQLVSDEIFGDGFD